MDFDIRFHDLKLLKSDLFLDDPFLWDVINDGNPISPVISTKKAQIELELSELVVSENLKQARKKFKKILEFWQYVSWPKCPELKLCALKLLMVFGTTYCCEAFSSGMKTVKNRHRSKLTYDHLQELLRVTNSGYEPDLRKIASEFRRYISNK